jgi:hypothetical protein
MQKQDKTSHTKCCNRNRIFPFRIGSFLTEDNKWKEATIYPDHVDGAYKSPEDQIAKDRVYEDQIYRRHEISNRIKRHFGIIEEETNE